MIVLQGICYGVLFVLVTLTIAAIDFAIRDLLKRRRDTRYPSEISEDEYR